MVVIEGKNTNLKLICEGLFPKLFIVGLRRQKSFDLVLLRWGLISFLLGEAACTVNYLFFTEESLFYEYLHSVGMGFSFSFFRLALFEGEDQRDN